MDVAVSFQVVSFNEWWEERHGNRRLALIDVRSVAEYYTCRIEHDEAVVVHLPLGDLVNGKRSSELPPRHVEFSVLVSDEQPCSLEQVEQFFGATKSKSTEQSRQPWLVRQILVASPDLWEDASKLSLVHRGNHMNSAFNGTLKPLPRLWKPDSMVEQILLPLLEQVSVTVDSSEKTEVWDLGSGTGRDVCFLAEQVKRFNSRCPLLFVGIDNHKASAQRCTPFWARRGVDDLTEARLLNLKKIDLVARELEKRRVICLYAVRFWNRKLVQLLSTSGSLRSGTIFAISHFCKPLLGAAWDFEHPREHHVLERDELREMFDHGGEWEILHDEIGPDGDHGRTMIQFVARRL